MDFNNAHHLEITKILELAGQGDRSAIDRLFMIFYDDLHQIACSYLFRERKDHALQPTVVVHEIYLKLLQQKKFHCKDRTHFLALGALLIRRMIIECARTRGRKKRRGRHIPFEICNEMIGITFDMEQMFDLDKALSRLEELDPRQVRIVELRFFGGLTMEEVAKTLKLSLRTVESDWHMARAWLRRELLDLGSLNNPRARK
jgi:RNA polymerase sigma factor (TIGR02999 family)